MTNATTLSKKESLKATKKGKRKKKKIRRTVPQEIFELQNHREGGCFFF
jgi:ribosomal protein S6E (S10)